ncbi:sensor histidine kinase [Geodermatophilus sp. CPCC 205761]|uniref:sensor histidine kinase n=1 Tax=Geodermatophilus sp. CPCC 205761 TaxID=2936597 RepID=UPI003EEC0970
MTGHVAWWSVQRPSSRSLALDVAFAAVCAYAGFVLATEAVRLVGNTDMLLSARLVAVLHGGSVAWRRVNPWAALIQLLLTAAVFVGVLGLPGHLLGPAVLFVVYGSAATLSRRWALLHLAVVVTGTVVLLRSEPLFPGWPSTVLYLLTITAAWCLGAVVRTLQVLARENGRRAAELEQARLELARSAVAAERLRMARELHDVLAHSMSVIAMQAGGARLAVGTNPDRERAMLAQIEGLTRAALAEMRRLVAILRDQDEEAAVLDPAPSLGRLHELVSRVVDAGLTVDVRTEGPLDDIPPGVSLTAYRVVQEALTNVLRHAAPTTARLAVRARAGLLTVCVEDEGPGGGPRPAERDGSGGPTGHGTVGMRERVALYGGTVTSGPAPVHGWRVEARIPYVEVTR